MQIVMKKTSELIPYARNNKIHNERQVKLVAASIQEFGFKNPVIVDKDNSIIAGHGRVKAAELLKLEEVPCIVADDLTKAQIKAYRIADNKLADLGEYDIEMLQLEVQELQEMEFDVELLGMDLEEFVEDKEIEEDEVPEVDETKEPFSKLGDIWLLGRHRLMCGDSTDKETVERLMNGQKADMVFTDPPYGVFATGGRSQTKEKLKMKAIENDDLQGNELTDFLSNFIKVMQYKEGASLYICYPWATQEEFTKAIKQNDLKIKNCIIWDKKVFGLNGHKGYRPQYEMIYFCCKNDFEWFGDKAQSNIWYVNREIKREEQGNHPTPKPIELIVKALNNSSKKEDLVYDAFGGSGSTLIACEQTNRINYSMELDPKYVDAIVKRYYNLGKDNIKLIRNGEVLEWETIKKDIVGD